jgi:hypothetical protein
MKRIPLANLRYENRFTVATLPAMKSIIRVETARLVKWFHVIPATGDDDAMCLLIQQAPKRERIETIQSRIIAEETARYA